MEAATRLGRTNVAVLASFLARGAPHQLDFFGGIRLARARLVSRLARVRPVEIRVEGEFDRLAHQ
jgi:hypothetical protein